MTVRARLRRSVITHRASAGAAVTALHAMGAHRAAVVVQRVRDDVATVTLPAAPGGHDQVRMRLRLHGGRDQAAAALRSAGWTGFERPMPDVFLADVRHGGGTVVDVGANTGFYTALAALADRHVVVHGFEPMPGVRDVLVDNCVLNGITRRVHIHAEAVGSSTGEAVLYIPPPADDQPFETSASLSPDFKDTIETELTVGVVTLDSWYRRHAQPRVSVVKVDVESRELDVLQGAARLVSEQRPVIFYELLPQGDATGISAFSHAHGLVDVRLRHPEVVVGEPARFDPDAWNHALVPMERLTDWLDRVRTLGMGVRDAR